MDERGRGEGRQRGENCHSRKWLHRERESDNFCPESCSRHYGKLHTTSPPKEGGEGGGKGAFSLHLCISVARWQVEQHLVCLTGKPPQHHTLRV